MKYNAICSRNKFERLNKRTWFEVAHNSSQLYYRILKMIYIKAILNHKGPDSKITKPWCAVATLQVVLYNNDI